MRIKKMRHLLTIFPLNLLYRRIQRMLATDISDNVVELDALILFKHLL